MQAHAPVYYTLDSHPDSLARAWAKLLQLAERSRQRALIASDAPNAEARIAELQQAPGDAAAPAAELELGFWSSQQPDPLTGSGWPAFALEVSPPTLLSLLEDRRISAVIYIPRSAAELRHFTQAYSDTSSV